MDNSNNLTQDLNLKGAVKMTPLQLNGIRLDVRHTVLTPHYLEQLTSSKDNAPTGHSLA